MAYIRYNNNPDQILTDDCTVRAISLILDQDWETTYVGLCAHGLVRHTWPSLNYVWGEYLERRG